MLSRLTRAAVRLGCRTVPLAARVQAETSSGPLAAVRVTRALQLASSARSLHTSPWLRSDVSTTFPPPPPAHSPAETEAKAEEPSSTPPSPSPALSPTATAPSDDLYTRRVLIRNMPPLAFGSDVEKMVAAALGEDAIIEKLNLQRRRLKTLYAAVDFREAQHAERLISLAPRMGDFEPTYKYSKPPVKVVKPSRTPLQRDPYRVAIVGLPADVAEEEVRRVVELSVGASVIGEITVAKKRHSPKDRSASRIAYLGFSDPSAAQRLLNLSPDVAGVHPRYRLATLDDPTDWVTPKTAPRSQSRTPFPSSADPFSPSPSTGLVPESLKNETLTKSKPPASTQDRPRGVFVGGLHSAITSVSLREAVTRALESGPEVVLRARVAVDAAGKSKGMAFIELRNSNLVNRLLPLAPSLLDSCPELTLTRARSSPKPFAEEDHASAPQNPPSNRLWVGHLPPLVTEQDLHQALGRIGGRLRRITLVEEQDKRTRKPRTSAYVTMQSLTEAQRILDASRTEGGMRVSGSQLVIGFASRREGKGKEEGAPAPSPKRGVVVAREVKGKAVGARRPMGAPVKVARELPAELLEPERLPRRSREERERERPRMLPRDDEGVDVGSNVLADLFRKI